MSKSELKFVIVCGIPFIIKWFIPFCQVVFTVIHKVNVSKDLYDFVIVSQHLPLFSLSTVLVTQNKRVGEVPTQEIK